MKKGSSITIVVEGKNSGGGRNEKKSSQFCYLSKKTE